MHNLQTLLFGNSFTELVALLCDFWVAEGDLLGWNETRYRTKGA